MDIRKLALYLFAVVNLFAMKPGFCDQLTADQAFALEAQVSATQRLELDWQIAPKHYLYKKQLSLMNANNESLLLENTLPSGKLIKDEVLGEYYVYEDHLSISVPLHKESANKELLLRYQGCAVDGFCYLPVNKLLKVSGDIVSVEDTTMQEFPVKYSANNLASMLADRFLPVTLFIFFVLGILLSFTPCVLPMIPIVVNLIVGPKKISSRKAFMLSGSYVIGMATCYTVAGIIAGMLGATLQAWLQQPFVLITLSILLVILALSQFELIHISLPHFNTRLHHWGEKQLQGSYFGAFILGILSALIVSPCITPPLIGALTYISQHGSPVIGGLALMSLGLGMGVPLIVVAMLSSMILPKAGEWMNVVKNFAGLALLGLAIWLMQRIVPAYVAVMLWGVLCIVAAILFKAFKQLNHPKRLVKMFKIFGIAVAIFGTALIMNTVYVHFISKSQSKHVGIQWHDINTVSELKTSLRAAKQRNQFTVLEFYAYWCTSCKRIEATVFGDPQVIQHLAEFNLLRVDMTDMDPKQKELLSVLNIYGPPAILFFNTQGVEIKGKRVIGELNAKEMLHILERL